MFDFLDDLASGAGKIIGSVTGLVVGVPVSVISKSLGLTRSMVQEALDAGCSTYEEIKEFWEDEF